MYILFALISISLWGTLAYASTFLTHIPPLLLLGITFSIAASLSLPRIRSWKVPAATLLVGVSGIFGFHFCLFLALRNAPPVEANLINYTWPLLIVLLSPLLLTGYNLKPHHLAGAFVGFAGAALILTGGRLELDPANLAGYLYAAAAAIFWSTYSVLTKRLPLFPTATVGAFCLISALLSLGFHFAFENSVALSGGDWMALLYLGLGPMGVAFYTWDRALKEGDPRIVGALSYLTPLLSTLVLIVAGGNTFAWSTAVAMALIVGGAVIGSADILRRKALRATP